jgi:hypothetical protein
MSEASIGSFGPFIQGVKEVRPSSGEISNSPELQGENMSKIGLLQAAHPSLE